MKTSWGRKPEQGSGTQHNLEALRQWERWGACRAWGHASAAAAGAASLPAPAAQAPTDTSFSEPGSTHGDPLPAELGRDPAPVITLPAAGSLPTLTHLPRSCHPLGFGSLVYIGKAWTRLGTGLDQQPPLKASRAAYLSEQPGKARVSCCSSPVFIRAGSPSPAAQLCCYQMGPVPAPGISSGASAAVSVPGGSQAAGVVLGLVSAGEQLCPELCAYSARLSPCPTPARRYCQHPLCLRCWLQLSSTAWGVQWSPSDLEGS